VGVVELVGLRRNGTLAIDRSSVLLLSVLPFFLLAVVHLVLMYGSWFQSPGVTANSGLKRGLFWILLLAFATVVIVLVWCFGLRAL
jgi:hypothetical protein